MRWEMTMVRARKGTFYSFAVSSIVLVGPGKKSTEDCLQGIHSIIQEMAGQWVSPRFNMILFIMPQQFRLNNLNQVFALED